MSKFLKTALSASTLLAGLALSSAAGAAPLGSDCSDCQFGFTESGTVTVDVLSNKGLFHHMNFYWNPDVGYVDLVAGVSVSGAYNGGQSVYGNYTSTVGFGQWVSSTTIGSAENYGYAGTGSTYQVVYGGANVVDVYIEDINKVTNVAAGDYDTHLRFTLTPVPEPETYGMMALGLGVMGFIARRRKQA